MNRYIEFKDVDGRLISIRIPDIVCLHYVDEVIQ